MKVIGVMSGTSLDGVDLAYVDFTEEKQLKYNLIAFETTAYTEEWRARLKNGDQLGALDFCRLHVEYGHFLGRLIHDFIDQKKLSVDLISCHGHTLFHQPENGLTIQIGDGAAICAETNLPVVNDFRSLDVALGGQGAPLVPLGDQLLFGEFDYCLNLGGIANISFAHDDQTRIAFDICPVNMILNELAGEVGFAYDKGGQMAEKGNLNNQLLKELNQLNFYQKAPPKSLGREWFVKTFMPVIKSFDILVADKLHTVCHHIAFQIGETINGSYKNSEMLVTGGGAKNDFVVSLLRKYCETKIIIPEEKIIDYKEALIFALLGYLRVQNKTNVLSSVTGATSKSISGALWGPMLL